MQKALDSRTTASKFGELVDKHGSEHWLEPLMEDLGPYVQLQLGDVANTLEVLDKWITRIPQWCHSADVRASLYHWRYPEKTVASLYFFGSALIFSLFASAAFCIKLLWFVMGGVFFVCWPISSLHPKYRYLVSPFKWVLWDIPTNGEPPRSWSCIGDLINLQPSGLSNTWDGKPKFLANNWLSRKWKRTIRKKPSIHTLASTLETQCLRSQWTMVWRMVMTTIGTVRVLRQAF